MGGVLSTVCIGFLYIVTRLPVGLFAHVTPPHTVKPLPLPALWITISFSDRQHNTCCQWLEYNFFVLLLPLSNTYEMHFKRRINVGIVDHRAKHSLGFDDGVGSGSCVLLWPFPHAVCLWSELHYTWTSQLALRVIHHVCKMPLQWYSVRKGRCWDVCHHVWLNGLKMVLMRIGFVFGPFFSLSLSVLSSPPLPGIIGKLRDADARLRSQFYVSQLNVPIFFFAQTKLISFLYFIFLKLELLFIPNPIEPSSVHRFKHGFI